MTFIMECVPWLVVAVGYGFAWGYDYGLRKGRAEHAQCHQATRALAGALRGVVRDAQDIKAWEEEL